MSGDRCGGVDPAGGRGTRVNTLHHLFPSSGAAGAKGYADGGEQARMNAIHADSRADCWYIGCMDSHPWIDTHVHLVDLLQRPGRMHCR